MEIYTIGFTKKTAAQFFGKLKSAGIKRLVDVRLNNISQLAGFTKRDDLEFFLREICEPEYKHETMLAPTQELLSAYRKKQIDWAEYERRFLRLITERHIERVMPRSLFDGPTALLCTEPTSEHCHRRLVVQYLQGQWPDIEIDHL